MLLAFHATNCLFRGRKHRRCSTLAVWVEARARGSCSFKLVISASTSYYVCSFRASLEQVPPAPGSASITLNVQARGPSQHRNIHSIFQIPVRKSYIKTAHALPSSRFSLSTPPAESRFSVLFSSIRYAILCRFYFSSMPCNGGAREAVAEAGSVAGCVQL
jgi:hypothetical protein